MAGVDISQWQSGEYSSADFYFVRLGYGVTEDPMAAKHIAYAKQNGKPLGVYWAMYEPHGADAAQACFHLMQTYGVYRVACDAEQFPNSPTLQPQTVKDFISTMQSLNGDCGIYSGYWAKSHNGSSFGADWGWLADYTAYDLPSGWTQAFTHFWQYTSNNGTLDQDKWTSSADMASWFQGSDMTGDELLAGVSAFLQGGPEPKDGPAKKIFDALTHAANQPKPVPGPQGPKGDPGPPGPAGSATVPTGTTLTVKVQ